MFNQVGSIVGHGIARFIATAASYAKLKCIQCTPCSFLLFINSMIHNLFFYTMVSVLLFS